MFETAYLRYNDFTGLVSLRANDGGDDIPVGYIEDIDLCPDQYIREWQWLRQEVRDAQRFAEGCARTAEAAHQARFNGRAW